MKSKISLGTKICIFIIILLVIALGIVCYLGSIKEKDTIAENVMQSTNSNMSENPARAEETNLNKATEEAESKNPIKETEYIEISILDKNAQGLEFTEPVQIADEEIINYLVEELNNSEKLSTEFMEENFIDFEGAPKVEFLQKDGTIATVVGDVFTGSYENKFVFHVSTRWDEEDKTTYKLNSTADLTKYIYDLYYSNAETESGAK